MLRLDKTRWSLDQASTTPTLRLSKAGCMPLEVSCPLRGFTGSIVGFDTVRERSIWREFVEPSPPRAPGNTLHRLDSPARLHGLDCGRVWKSQPCSSRPPAIGSLRHGLQGQAVSRPRSTEPCLFKASVSIELSMLDMSVTCCHPSDAESRRSRRIHCVGCPEAPVYVD